MLSHTYRSNGMMRLFSGLSCSSKVVILTFLFCLLPFVAWGQPQATMIKQSDSLYAKGVELYQKRHFEDAFSLFEQCQGIDTILYNVYQSRRSYAEMWMASCLYMMGKENEASSLYDQYMAPPVDRRLTVASDSVCDIVTDLLYVKQDVNASLPYIRELIRLETEELGEQNIWVGNSYYIYGNALYEAGQYAESVEMLKRSQAITASQCGEKSNPYLTVLVNLVSAWIAISDEGSAIAGAEKIVDICTELGTFDSYTCYYGHLIWGEGLFAQMLYENAISHFQEAARILRANQLEKSVKYGELLSYLGRTQLVLAQKEAALETMESAFSLLNNIVAYDPHKLTDCMNYMGQAQFVNGDTLMSINTFKEAISFMERQGIANDCLYPELNYNVSQCYVALNNKQSAYEYAEKAIKSYKELGCGDMIYTGLLIDYSVSLSEDGRYKDAINMAKEALDFVEQIPNTPDSIPVIYRALLAKHYLDNGDVDTAYYHAKIVIADVESVFSSNSILYVITLQRIAGAFFFSTEKEECTRLLCKALSRVEKMMPNSDAQCELLSNLAEASFLLGRYTEAVDYQKKSVDLIEILYGKTSEAYSTANSLLLKYLAQISDPFEINDFYNNNLAGSIIVNNEDNFYIDANSKIIEAQLLGNFLQADSLYDELCKKIEQNFGLSADYASTLINYGYNKIYLGEFEDALTLSKRAHDIFADLFGVEKFEKYYYIYWNLVGVASSFLGRYDDAENAFEHSILASMQFFGEDNLEHLSTQMQLAVIKEQKNDIDGSMEIMKSLFPKLREQIFMQFSTMSASERMALWSKFMGVIDHGMPFLAYHANDPAFFGDTYNALLLSKGFLLNTEQEVSQLILKSNDAKAVETYHQLLNTRQQLDMIRKNAASFDIAKVDSLRELVKQRERELISLSSAFGDFTNNIRIDWTDVRKKLGKNDVAIEFADFFENDGTNVYVALVLTKKMEIPQLIRLFNYSEVERILTGNVYNNDSLYQFVWKPLEIFLQPGSKVYFSPSGILNNYAIESLPTNNGNPISDYYDIYRLTSTRELVVKQHEKRKHKAALFGGIDYDANPTVINDVYFANNESPQNSNSTDPNMNVIIHELHRGALVGPLYYLDGTKTEIDSISFLFVKHKDSADIFIGEKGSETTMKSLSATDYTILHLATHGFYLPLNSAPDDPLFSVLSFSGMNQEDWSLSRSGLFFAGANITLTGDMPRYEKDDGILTANEVASLDLQNIDLVTLSACETGLGDVTGEGVFGLQRGFKKAGVKTLLMSLWKVDDDATCLLMTEFYRNWIGLGQTKHNALEHAKKTVRSHKRWNDPTYWAAFILLDAIE